MENWQEKAVLLACLSGIVFILVWLWERHLWNDGFCFKCKRAWRKISVSWSPRRERGYVCDRCEIDIWLSSPWVGDES